VASQLLGLPSALTLVSCLAYSTLKMEVICSSKTFVDFQWTTQHCIPEDSTLHKWESFFFSVQITGKRDERASGVGWLHCPPLPKALCLSKMLIITY
jgi:hypothetical protein